MRKLFGCFYVLLLISLPYYVGAQDLKNKSFYTNLQDFKTKQFEISCDEANVRIEKKCLNPDSYDKHCIEENITFTNKKTGETIKIPAAGQLVDETDVKGKIIGQTLDYEVSTVECLKGKDASYLMIVYANGGNCDDCEFGEIYSLKGLKLANRQNFDKVYKKLGLHR